MLAFALITTQCSGCDGAPPPTTSVLLLRCTVVAQGTQTRSIELRQLLAFVSTMHRSRPTDIEDGYRLIRSALQDAADQARLRRRVVRWALIVLGAALGLLGMLLLGGPT
jgi:hypothetical protein